MMRVRVYDESDSDEGTVSIEFTFDGRAYSELDQAAALLKMARSFAPDGSRLACEMPAHAAYFEALVAGLRTGLDRASAVAIGKGEAST